MQTVQTRTLDTADVDTVRAAVDKANRKATKLGQPGFTLDVEDAEPREITVPDPLKPGCRKVIGHVAQSTVTVTGEAPRIAGWTFVATLDWDEVSRQAVIRKVEGLDIDLSPARPTFEWCDHCNTARARSNTFLLRSDDGEFKQVGSTCLREFLGIEVPLYWIGFQPYESVEDNSPRRPERLLVLQTFEDVLALVRGFGWVSAGASRENGKTATKTWYAASLWDRSAKGQGADAREAIATHHHDGDAELASAVLEWVRGCEDTSEYISNLKAALAADTFSVSNLGLVVSAPFAYQRWVEREEGKARERKEQAASTYVGSVKERLRGLRLTVNGLRYIDGVWGVTTLLLLRDEGGNVYKWFASNAPQVLIEAEGHNATNPYYNYRDVEKDDVLVLDGTVKAHEEYNGIKSTVLTRCKVKEETS